MNEAEASAYAGLRFHFILGRIESTVQRCLELEESEASLVSAEEEELTFEIWRSKIRCYEEALRSQLKSCEGLGKADLERFRLRIEDLSTDLELQIERRRPCSRMPPLGSAAVAPESALGTALDAEPAGELSSELAAILEDCPLDAAFSAWMTPFEPLADDFAGDVEEEEATSPAPLVPAAQAPAAAPQDAALPPQLAFDAAAASAAAPPLNILFHRAQATSPAPLVPAAQTPVAAPQAASPPQLASAVSAAAPWRNIRLHGAEAARSGPPGSTFARSQLAFAAELRGKLEEELTDLAHGMRGAARSFGVTLKKDNKTLDEISKVQEEGLDKVTGEVKKGKAMVRSGQIGFVCTIAMLVTNLIIFLSLIPFIIVT